MKKYMFQAIILILSLSLSALGFLPSLAFSQPFPEKPAARLGKKGALSGELAYSPDGLLLAVTGSLGVWLYDAKDLTQVGLLEGHATGVTAIAFSPDGKTLASGYRDGTIRLWEVQEKKQLAVLEGHSDLVDSLAFSPDEEILASGSWDRTIPIQLWDVQTQKQVAMLSMEDEEGHASWVWGLAFSPSGDILASAGYDKTVRLWEVQEKKQLAVLKHIMGVWFLAFSPDGKILATGRSDTLWLWNVMTQKQIVELKDYTNLVSSLAFSPDGKILALGGDRVIRLWDIQKQEQVGILQGHAGRVQAIAFSRNGKWLASGGSDSTILLWEMNFESPFLFNPEGLQPIIFGKLKHTMLLQNFPNPFNPETWIPYELAEESEVTLTIYNVKGKHIRAISLGRKPAGIYKAKEDAIHWDGRNDKGERVSSGMYFYTIQTGEFTDTRRMLLLK